MRRRRWSQGELERAEREVGLVENPSPSIRSDTPVPLSHRVTVAAAVLGAVGFLLGMVSVSGTHVYWAPMIVAMALSVPAACLVMVIVAAGIWEFIRWVVTGR